MIGYFNSLKLLNRFRSIFFPLQLEEAVLKHHLRLFGLRNLDRVEIVVGGNWRVIDPKLKDGGVVIVLKPSLLFLEEGGIKSTYESAGVLEFDREKAWGPLRTLHRVLTLHHDKAEAIARSKKGSPVWVKFDVLGGTLFLIGSDVVADLVRYRQGDPAAANQKDKTSRLWDFDMERPVYLFEKQLEGLHSHERPADVIAMGLVTAISSALGVSPRPLLPDGAPGAVVITGDDDQAYLEKYKEQLEVLGELPITYFLHPSTRHDKNSIKSMLGSSNIDLGLHPDALDAPEDYGRLFQLMNRQ